MVNDRVPTYAACGCSLVLTWSGKGQKTETSLFTAEPRSEAYSECSQPHGQTGSKLNSALLISLLLLIVKPTHSKLTGPSYSLASKRD
jgi:hypothetical protein